MARKLENRYTFTPGAAGVGTVTIDALYQLNEILMITNVTDNVVIYNFSDTTRGGVISSVYSSTAPTTTITLNFDTSAMSSSDKLQIYVESAVVKFTPEERLMDPVSKFRVSQPNTLIDTDFEYGLQATKWETLELVNNIPGFFSKTGDTPLGINGVTGVTGSKICTVSATAHGLTVGTPIDVRGLRQPTLEGSYLVASVPDDDTFTFIARTVTTTGGTISGVYTTIIPGKFYAGSDVSYVSIETDGGTPSSTITVTTDYNPGFNANTEFYLINTLGTTQVSFDAATSVQFVDTNVILNTFNPDTVNSSALYTSGSKIVDPWDYTGYISGTKYFYGGAGGNVNARTITITGHGFTGNDTPVALIPGPSATAPTGLIANAGYFVKVIDANNIALSANLNGVDMTMTASSGSGVIGLYRGFFVSATATTDLLTLAGKYANFTGNTTSSTPMAWFTANTVANVSGLQTAATGIFSRTNPGYLYNGGGALSVVAGATQGLVYWNGSTNAVSLTAGGGTAIDITAATVGPQTVIVPLATNAGKNSIYVPNHGYLDSEPVFYYAGGGTAIGGLTTNTTYYIDFISSSSFGLKPTAGGARIELTNYGAGTNHQVQYARPRTDKDSLNITSHGLTDGAIVQYSANGGTVIPGLTDGVTYYVRDASTNSLKLTTSLGGTAIDLTAAGTGTQLLVQTTTGSFDGTYLTDSVLSTTQFTLSSDFTVPVITKTFSSASVDSTNNYITIAGHRLPTGANVQYTNGTGTDVGGLTDNGYYYVYRFSKDRIKLAGNLEAALAGTPLIDLTSAGTGTDHTLTTRNLAGESTGVGTVSVTSTSDLVTGVGTKFLRTFKAGDTIVIDNGASGVVTGIILYVLSDTEMTLTAVAGSTVSAANYLVKTGLYVKSGAWSLHRPFDGGVEINAGLRADTQIVRQTRRYFRYQSGKGMQSSFAINFNPPIDIQNLSADGLVGTAITRKVHGLRVGQAITIRDAEVQSGTNYFNGDFIIDTVPTETTFTYTLLGTPNVVTAEGFPQLVVTEWGGSRMRAGMFDFQNGMYYEYDGNTLYAVRRSSTQQLAGTVSVTKRSNIISGTNTLFQNQLEVGDFVVIRGQSYKVVEIASNSAMTVQPAYRGSTQDQVICSLTQETRVAQQDWSLDPCDGTGPSRYVLDTTRIQMTYMDYAWYGAGKVRFGFKGVDGEVFYAHEFKHNNRKTEAYLRSGNLPARYEILNYGSPLYAPSLAHWGTSVIMDGTFEDDNAYLFTAPSIFLTYSGSAATVTGVAAAVNYFYVNADGTTTNTVSTVSNVTISVSGNASINNTSELITYANHGLLTGQLVRYNFTSGTNLSGLTNGSYYYAIRASVDAFGLATTAAGATANTRINITSTTGTYTFGKNYTFVPTLTTVAGYGSRLIHRFVTDTAGYAAIGNVPFGTVITSTPIAARVLSGQSARVYRVIAHTTSGAAQVDFFFTESVATVATTSTNGPASSTGFMAGVGPYSATGTTFNSVAHTLGSETSIPTLIPLISIRLAPSVDSGLTGKLGERDVINRMQETLKTVGCSTTHDVELRLILNGQLDNQNWVNQGIPSLSQLILHETNDVVSGGIEIFNFRATGNSPTASGLRTANTFAADISSILALGNAILGGDGTYPDGPDTLTLAAIPLSTSGITVNAPFSVAGRITWSESQA